MLNHLSQTSAASPVETTLPYSFEVRVKANNAINIATWGPNFYRPLTGGAPDSGAASNTNTGTKNFSGSPNSGADFFFQANYNTAGAMAAAYPTSGSYGINFTGAGHPSTTTFTSGLTFTTGTYSVSTPQVTAFDNGASWSSGSLNVSTSGLTNLSISAFSEYLNSSVAAQIQWRLTNQSGTAIDGAGVTFGSGYSDAAITQFAITGSTLTAGQTYTLSIQYGIVAGAPGTTSLNGTTFTGVTEYWNHTDITITAVPEPSTYAVLAGLGALGFAAYRRRHRHLT